MTEDERSHGDRRPRLLLAVAGTAVGLGVVVLMVIGNGLRAPSAVFDSEGTACALGEGMNQVATIAQVAAVNATAGG